MYVLLARTINKGIAYGECRTVRASCHSSSCFSCEFSQIHLSRKPFARIHEQSSIDDDAMGKAVIVLEDSLLPPSVLTKNSAIVDTIKTGCKFTRQVDFDFVQYSKLNKDPSWHS